MAVHDYLNKEGLSQLWNKAKAAFADKTETTTELNKKFELPSDGDEGQFIKKTSSGTEWGDPAVATATTYGIVRIASDEEFDSYIGLTQAKSFTVQVAKLAKRVDVAEARLNISEE